MTDENLIQVYQDKDLQQLIEIRAELFESKEEYDEASAKYREARNENEEAIAYSDSKNSAAFGG